MRILSLALLCLSLGACGSEAVGDKSAFRFSAIPDEKPTENEARFARVAEYLAEKLGIKVEYMAVTNYSGSVQAFKNGDIDAAWFGGLSGVQARLAVKGSEAIAQGMEDPNFYSYFIAHKDSGLQPGEAFPKAAAGKKFTFGEAGSTSGRLMPEFFIRAQTGKEPKKFFSEVGFAKNHPGTLAAVNSGAFDVGALNYKVYDHATPEEKRNTVLLWKTPTYADYNFTVRGDLDKDFGPGFTAKLKAAFLAMPADLCEKCFSRKGMIEAKNADFQKIETTAKALDLAR